MYLTYMYEVIIPKPRTLRHQAARRDTEGLQLLPGIKNGICPRPLSALPERHGLPRSPGRCPDPGIFDRARAGADAVHAETGML